MKGTLEDFKAHAEKCSDEYEADQVAFSWLRLTCMDHGTAGEHAFDLLKVVESMLRD